MNKNIKKNSKDFKYDSKFVRKTIRFTRKEYEKIQNQLKLLNINFTKFVKRAILEYKTTLKNQSNFMIIFE